MQKYTVLYHTTTEVRCRRGEEEGPKRSIVATRYRLPTDTIAHRHISQSPRSLYYTRPRRTVRTRMHTRAPAAASTPVSLHKRQTDNTQLWLVSVHWSMGTDGGVTKSLDDIPSHWGLNSTCKLYVPAGRLIITTVTPGFG